MLCAGDEHFGAEDEHFGAEDEHFDAGDEHFGAGEVGGWIKGPCKYLRLCDFLCGSSLKWLCAH